MQLPGSRPDGGDSSAAGVRLGRLPDGGALRPEPCAFEEHVELGPSTARRVRSGLDAVARSLDGQHHGEVSTAGARLAELTGYLPAQHPGPVLQAMVLDREDALDLAAALLDLADWLFGAGFPIEALALEGVEAHLIGALVTPRDAGG